MNQAIKEHPLLFNGEMVRAILDGRKLQTRRIMPNLDICHADPCVRDHNLYINVDGYINQQDECGRALPVYLEDSGKCAKCKYEAGHRIWVRETWRPEFADGTIFGKKSTGVWYEATDDVRPVVPNMDQWVRYFNKNGNAPSIFMFRWASRILLEITDVRIERVQDITDADAIAEGIVDDGEYKGYCPDCRGEGIVGFVDDYQQDSRDCKYHCDTPRGAFLAYWDSIYSGINSVDANPWLAPLTFKVLEVKS